MTQAPELKARLPSLLASADNNWLQDIDIIIERKDGTKAAPPT